MLEIWSTVTLFYHNYHHKHKGTQTITSKKKGSIDNLALKTDEKQHQETSVCNMF